MELEVRIERLGAQGDGLAQGPDGPLFVPFTLPGELVKVAAEPGEPRAEALAILEPSPERVAPVCQYFGTCGGCALQHIEARAYLAWKREQVIAALASRGLEVPVGEVRAVPLASRRRAAFTLGRTARGVAFGYRAARSHAIVDIAACPVLNSSIVGRLPKLKSLLALLLGGKREARVTVTEADQGLDVAVEGIRPSAGLFAKLAATGARIGAARITIDGESVILAGEPSVTLSGAQVRLPPGAFLQASRESDAVLAGLVKSGVGRAKRVADLFAGIGTFTFALAGSAEVDAFEQDEAGAHIFPRSLPRPSLRTRACPLRRCRPRSAAGRRQGAGQGAGRFEGAEGRHGLVQSRHLRARPEHPRRWRLPHHARGPRRPVPVLAAYRVGGCAAAVIRAFIRLKASC